MGRTAFFNKDCW